MINLYKNRLIKAINSDTLKKYAQLNNEKAFTRKKKMPLEDIILCTLSKKGLTTEMELHKHFIEKVVTSMNISKQGFLQQRKKLNYEAFSFLNKVSNFFFF